MVNRCERCNRKLSDPNASYGWRCAEILGVGDIISNSPIEVYERFEKGVLNANKLLKGSNVSLSEERKKDFYNANIKMSLWDGIDELASKNARKDSYAVLLGTNKKYEELTDTLKEFNSYFKEHKAYYDKDDLLFKGTNMVADAIWNSAALALEVAGYKLSGDLLRVSLGESNPICLKLVKFVWFQFVGFVGRQPNFNLRIKTIANFPAFKVEELKNKKFCYKTKKIQK